MGPAVTGAGEFGVYSGAVSFVDGGPLGRIVQFEDGECTWESWTRSRCS